MFKITSLIGKFHLNVAIASIYEVVRLLEESLSKNISGGCFIKSQASIMKAMMPFTPHLSCECLSKLEGKNFYQEIEWPQINKSFLVDDKVIIVIQINGKKRSLIRLPINSDENFVIEKAKLESNVKKYLINNNIKKQIYVKNRLINFII